MPALPPVPQVIRTDITWSRAEDSKVKCRFFMRYSGTAPAAGDLTAACTSLYGAYGTDLKGLATPDVILQSMEMTDLTSPTSAVGSYATAVPGTASEAALPADTSALVSGHISRRYRGGHPRIYLPFGGQGHLADAQTWSSGFVNALQSDWDAFMLAATALTWTGATIAEIVNVSFYEGFHLFTGPTGRVRNIPTVRVTPLVDAISGWVARTGVASIRKRLLGLA